MQIATPPISNLKNLLPAYFFATVLPHFSFFFFLSFQSFHRSITKISSFISLIYPIFQNTVEFLFFKQSFITFFLVFSFLENWCDFFIFGVLCHSVSPHERGKTLLIIFSEKDVETFHFENTQKKNIDFYFKMVVEFSSYLLNEELKPAKKRTRKNQWHMEN